MQGVKRTEGTGLHETFVEISMFDFADFFHDAIKS